MATIILGGEYNRAKEIIEQYIDDINENEFTNLYLGSANSIHSEITKILHDAEIYPEHHLVTLPICFRYDDTDVYELNIPDNVKVISGQAFSNCSNLYKLNLGKVEVIGTQAFFATEYLKSLTIPKTVTIIASKAFASSEIDHIHYEGTKEEWMEIDIHPSAFNSINAKIVHCKDGYLNIEEWSQWK